MNDILSPIKRILLYPACLLVFVCCDKKPKEQAANSNQSAKSIPIFTADSAYQYVKKQVDFGPRVPNTKAHIACGDYLIAQLKAFGFEVQVQEFQKMAFDGQFLRLRNIIGTLNPEAGKRILLTSHWDSRPFADQDSIDPKKPILGANDGASGVGILLEVARTLDLSKEKPNIGVDIIFFDGEDYGQPENSGFPEQEDTWCLGSQYWSKSKHKDNYMAYYGILLDMVGAKNAKFGLEGTSRMFAGEVMKKVWDNGNAIGYGDFFVYQETSPILDDHHYVNKDAKIPMIDIIEYDPSDDVYFGWYWHTHRDDMRVIDPKTLKAVGQTLIQTLYTE